MAEKGPMTVEMVAERWHCSDKHVRNLDGRGGNVNG